MKKMMALSCAAFALAAATRAQTFDSSGYGRRMGITFSGYAGGETLANFPAMIRLGANVTTNMLENGDDLRFTDANGALLPHEIASWDTNGLSTVWVRVPSLVNSATAIIAYWGNGEAVAPDNSHEVWSEYRGVWHLTEDGDTMRDSTIYGNHGARSVGTVTSNGVATASQFLWGGGITIPHNAALDVGSAFGVSAFFKRAQEPSSMAWARYFTKKANDWQYYMGWEIQTDNSDPDHLQPRGNNAGNGDFYLNGGNAWAAFENRNWNHTHFRFYNDPGNTGVGLWINGSLMGWTGLGYGTATDNPDSPLVIAGGWQGFVCEARLEVGGARSADWLAACAQTMSNPAFAVCGEPKDNDTVVFAFSAGDLSWDSATLTLAASIATEVNAWLFWDEDDGDSDDPLEWKGAPILLASGAPVNAMSTNLTGLSHATAYKACYAITNDFEALVFDAPPVTFQTLATPLAALGAVAFDFAPASAGATVNVATTGHQPVLVFMWDDEAPESGDAWANVYTNFNPVAGANNIPLPLLPIGAVQAWRAELVSAFNTVSASGDFYVAYKFTWTGGAGDGLWMSTNNWDLGAVHGIVPDNPCDIVTLPAGGYAVDLAGMGSATIGALSMANNSANGIWSSDGVTPLIFDNGGAAAVITVSGANGNYTINAPVQLAGETRASAYIVANETCFALFGGVTSVPGKNGWLAMDNLGLNYRPLALGAPAGTTRRVEVPIAGGHYVIRNPGTLVLEGVTGTIYVFGNGFVGDGAHFILSESSISTYNLADMNNLFNGGNNHFEITDGSYFAWNVDRLRMGANNNTITVSGAGSEMLFGANNPQDFFFNAANNTLNILDGGRVAPWSNGIGFSFGRGLDGNPSWGDNNLVRVAGADTNGVPATLALGDRTLTMNGTDCKVSVGPGGLLNIGTLHVGWGTFGNRFVLDAGAAHIGALNINDGNALAPVLTPALRDGGFTVTAGTVNFQPGSRIICENPNRVFGVFPLVESASAITLPEGLLDDAPKNMAWSLVLEDDDTKLSLSCHPHGTLLILK